MAGIIRASFNLQELNSWNNDDVYSILVPVWLKSQLYLSSDIIWQLEMLT